MFIQKKVFLSMKILQLGIIAKALLRLQYQNTSILESALKENSYKLFWVFRVYRSPSNKAYELYGNQICHDTDRSFVVWFDEEECKYIELKEIKPIRPNTYDDYELNIKILYGDAED